MSSQREILARVLALHPETGQMLYRARPRSDFATKRAFTAWNNKYVGKPALTSKHCAGYLTGKLGGRCLLAHRVAWIIANGEIPAGYEIDHINGVRTDNRLSNLRLVPPGENQKNNCIPSSNTSGVIGVSWFSSEKKWRARIRAGGKEKHLGLFTDFDSAVRVRKQAEKDYGFHPNHGRSAE